MASNSAFVLKIKTFRLYHLAKSNSMFYTRGTAKSKCSERLKIKVWRYIK